MSSSLLASGAPAPLLAAAVLLVAALGYVRGWRVAPWLAGTAAAILAGALAARGLRAGHWPLTNQYEVALAFALGTTLATLPVPLLPANDEQEGGPQEPSYRGGLSLLLAVALVLYARLLIPGAQQAIRPLPPTLNSPWLPLHVGTAALAYGALAMTGLAGLTWLIRGPERPAAERTLDRSLTAGYPLLTLSMILGMIWAQVAWGRVWGWDLKEVWTLITWLVCTLAYHLRGRPRWQGRGLAWLALLALGAVLFTFLGVGWLARAVGLESLHMF